MATVEIANRLQNVDNLFRALCIKRRHFDARTKAFQQSERGLVLEAAYCESYDALMYLRKELTDGRL